MLGTRRVTVDSFPESAFRYLEYDAIVCVDIIRTTTTLVTAVAQGRRAFPAADPAHAAKLAAGLRRPLLAGESDRGLPAGFEIQNSPSELDGRTDVERPLVLCSSIGTELIVNAAGCAAVYVASLRNFSATASLLAARHRSVAVLTACSRGQLRCEDQMGAARLVKPLLAAGFEPEGMRTLDLVSRWANAELSLLRWSTSAEHLRRIGHLADLEFILKRVDDVHLACRYEGDEIRAVYEGGEASKKVLTGDFRRAPSSRVGSAREAISAVSGGHPVVKL